MGFYERAKSATYSRGGTRCRIEAVLADQPDEWLEYAVEQYGEKLPWDDYTKQVHEAFDDPTVGPAAITRLLKEDGLVISQSSVARHNRKECACPAS